MEKKLSIPKVSVVIPAYNEEKYIEDCIKSVQNQQINFAYEIIVVDNASADKTGSIAKELGVKVIREDKKGLAYARAAGLNAAKGEILVYLDADVRLTEGWLSKMVDYLDTHQDVVGVSCNSYFYDGTFFDNFGSLLFQVVLVPIATVILRIFQKPDIFLGFAMVIRTKALKDAGGIDLRFVFYGEDAMIALRLSSQGKVRFLSNVFVQSSARRYQKQGAFNTLFLYWKTFLLIQFGRFDKAKEFSHKYSS